MKQLFFISIFLFAIVCFGQTKPKSSKFPQEKEITNPTKIPNRIETPTIPTKKVPKKIEIAPSLSGKWTNTSGNMIYFFKGSGNTIYFFAEEDNVDPSWSIVGKAVPGTDHVYRFEYGIISETGTFGFDDWILYDDLKGSFMNARQNKVWNVYKGNLARANSKYSPPAPNSTNSTAYVDLSDSGIFTDLRREFMLQIKTIGTKVIMFGENVTGALSFFGTGTKTPNPNGFSNSYILTMDITSAHWNRTAQYSFLLDRKGLSYLSSSDCYRPIGNSSSSDCPHGMMFDWKERLIRLSTYDRNRTVNVQENIERNRHYFDYKAPASTNEDNRLKDADYDGHNSLAFNGDDCDDTDSNRFPGNPEVADFEGHDEDCNPDTIGVMDKDGDGFTDWRVCNKDDKGRILKSGDDCDDNDPSVHPNSIEVCDGKDNNCNGEIDEGVSHLFYRDNDNDGFGDPNERLGIKACFKPVGYSENNLDCDDTDKTKTTNCN